MAADLESARALRDAQLKSWSQSQAEIQVWRPTPTRDETSRIAAGDPVMLKDPDGSPVDPAAIDALDPNVPPPDDPRVPMIVGTPEVGQLLCALPGVISSPQHAFQWLRGDKPIRFATALRYRLVAEDAGCMIGFAALMRSRKVEIGPSYILLGTARQVGPVRRPAGWPSAAAAAD